MTTRTSISLLYGSALCRQNEYLRLIIIGTAITTTNTQAAPVHARNWVHFNANGDLIGQEILYCGDGGGLIEEVPPLRTTEQMVTIVYSAMADRLGHIGAWQARLDALHARGNTLAVRQAPLPKHMGDSLMATTKHRQWLCRKLERTSPQIWPPAFRRRLFLLTTSSC